MRALLGSRIGWLIGGGLIGAALAVALFAALGGAGSGGGPPNKSPVRGPVLASGVALVTGGRVVATWMPNTQKVGKTAPPIQVATAPIDASGHFVLRPDPTQRAMAKAIVDAIANNDAWVNLDLWETGADGKAASWGISRQYVDASGRAVSLTEFRATPGIGHWVGDAADGGTTVVPTRGAIIRPATAARLPWTRR